MRLDQFDEKLDQFVRTFHIAGHHFVFAFVLRSESFSRKESFLLPYVIERIIRSHLNGVIESMFIDATHLLNGIVKYFQALFRLVHWKNQTTIVCSVSRLNLMIRLDVAQSTYGFHSLTDAFLLFINVSRRC
jgi:hypothetical protein